MATNNTSNDVILLVEDEETQARPFAEMLEHRGFRVLNAYNGSDALELAARYRPRLVIVDLLLVSHGDEMDGYELIGHLRRTKGTASVCIMAWTAHFIRPQDEIRALRIGADSFVNKDSEYGLLEARIEALVRRANMDFSG